MNVDVKVKYKIEDDYTMTPSYLCAYISYRVEGVWRRRKFRMNHSNRGVDSMTTFYDRISRYLTTREDERKLEIQNAIIKDIDENYRDKRINKLLKEGMSFSFTIKE